MASTLACGLIRTYTAVVGPTYLPQDGCFGDAEIFRRPEMEAKRYKILPHLFFPDADISIWHDGNIWPLVSAERLMEQFLGDADLAVFCHPYRQTVWEEFTTLRKNEGRFRIPFLQQQLQAQEDAYRSEGLPVDAPLYECNFLIRRHTDAVNRLMEAWWAQICRWQWRDQVSFPYVLWKHPVDVSAIPNVNIRTHPDFRYVKRY